MKTGLEPMFLNGVYEDLTYEIEQEIKNTVGQNNSIVGENGLLTEEQIENAAKIVTQALIRLQESENPDEEYTGIFVGKYYLQTNRLIIDALIMLAEIKLLSSTQVVELKISEVVDEIIEKINLFLPGYANISKCIGLMKSRITAIGKEEFCPVLCAYEQQTSGIALTDRIMAALKACPYRANYLAGFHEDCKRYKRNGCILTRDDVVETLTERGKPYGIKPLPGNPADFMIDENIIEVIRKR